MEWSYLCVFVLGLCCVAPVVWGQNYTSACLPGWYGTQCQSSCQNSSCLLNTCDRTTGRCLACKAGYAGINCTACPQGNYEQGGICRQCSSGCVNNQCNNETGTCSCQPGYHGVQCMSPCSSLSSRCTQCSQDGTCTACTGNFMAPVCTECAQGYYKKGTTCQQCSSGCVNNQCNRETGTCTSGCLPGKHGNLCDKSCLPGNCLLNTCNQTTGRCLVCNTGFGGDTCTGCAPGYYRELGGGCQQCSSGCKDNKCDDYTGKCDGCVPGRYRNQCNYGCQSSKCLDNQCDQTSGDCTDCAPGVYSPPSCTTSCKSINCLNNQCNKTSGLCLSCSTKYVGDFCQECQAGRWGGQCKKRCHVNCVPHTCGRYNGTCTGCRPGYHGQRCNESCSTIADQCGQCTQSGQCTACSGYFQPPQCTGIDSSLKAKGSDQSHLAVVSGILGTGLMVTIAVLVFLCWRFKSQLIVQKPDTLTSVYADPVTAGSNAYTEPPSVALSPPDEACGNTQHEIRDPGNPYEQLRVYSNMMFDRKAHLDPEPRGIDVTTPKSTSEYVNVTLEHVYANMSSGPKTKKKPRKKKAK